MNRLGLAFLSMLVTTAGGAFAACSSSSGNGNAPQSDAGGANDGTAGDSAGDAMGGNYQIEVPCTDTIDSIYADPGTLPAAKGAIIRCAKDKDISKADLQMAAQTSDPANDAGYPGTPGYTGKPLTSGAHVYRILYRTERGDSANTAGYSSGIVYVPDTPRAALSPIVVVSHGSRGQAAHCAASKLDPAASDVNPDYLRLVYPLVGAGYAVVMSDFAGYANYGAAGNPPSAYGSAADQGKSSLDSARALKNVLGHSLSDKTILVGHSIGGQASLFTLALSSSYAPELNIAGVAVYSPGWISARALGAILADPNTYSFNNSALGSVAIWYGYTHGELMDGPGHGKDLFAAAKQATVKSFVDNDCWNSSYPDLLAMGSSANDYFDPAFISAIKIPAATNGDCSGSSDPALCQKWMDRFVADWPHFMGSQLQVPILSLYGGQDTTITPDLAACVFTRYKADMASYKVCFEPTANHSGIVALRADYVNDWIAARALGGPEPAACPNDEHALVDDAGAPIQCNPLVPPN